MKNKIKHLIKKSHSHSKSLFEKIKTLTLDTELITIFSFKINLAQIILLGIIIFAAYLRITYLGEPPFWVDESISALVGKEVLLTGTQTLGSGYIYSGAPIFHMIEAISFFIFGINDFAARFPSVILGLLTIIVCYLIGKEYSKHAGISAALLCAVFFIEVYYSRQARFYQLFQLLFFTTIYTLYKSKDQPKYLLLTILCFIGAVTTQPSGIILAPFIILHILLFNKKYWFVSIISAGWALVSHGVIDQIGASAKIQNVATTIAEQGNVIQTATKQLFLQTPITFIIATFYFLLGAIPGAIIGLKKNWRLTILVAIPAGIIFFGIMFVDLISFRYVYVCLIPVFIFFGVFVGTLWKKYTPIVFVIFILFLYLCSNVGNPQGYNIMFSPPDTGFADPSAPELNLKTVPEEVIAEMQKPESIIITHFSPIVEWYIKKPTLVLPFTLNGHGNDQVSILNDKNELVDWYSGAPIMTSWAQKPKGAYFVVQTYFATNKLKGEQRTLFSDLIFTCKAILKNRTAVIYYCPPEKQTN